MRELIYGAEIFNDASKVYVIENKSATKIPNRNLIDKLSAHRYCMICAPKYDVIVCALGFNLIKLFNEEEGKKHNCRYKVER